MPKRYLTADERRAQVAEYLCKLATDIGEGKPVPVELLPSNMAAGPCEPCLRAAKYAWTTADAPLLPIEGCPHPDQCACIYKMDGDRFFA